MPKDAKMSFRPILVHRRVVSYHTASARGPVKKLHIIKSS